jgi:hypothetical protein
MTRLRPLVVPVAVLTIATAAPSAHAQPRRSVNQWADPPTALSLAAQHADNECRYAAIVQPATSLPFAVLEPPGEAVIPDGRSASAAPPAVAVAAGRPATYSARAPP